MTLPDTDRQAFEAFEKAGWEKAATPYQLHWGTLAQQSVEPMLDAASVRDGSTVLDVATGAGHAAAAAMRRGADATGLDFCKAQITLARQTHPDITFEEGSADALPFDDNAFDAVVMGFGINHLPDPDAAVGEAFRVLRPGGRLALTVWAAPEAGTGFGIVLSAIEEHGASTVVLPPAPPYFRFADADEVKRVFMQTGFDDPHTTLVPQYWRHGSADQVFDAFNEGAVRATALLKAQPDAARKRIRTAVRHEVQALQQGDRFVIPVPASLSSGRKPL